MEACPKVVGRHRMGRAGCTREECSQRTHALAWEVKWICSRVVSEWHVLLELLTANSCEWPADIFPECGEARFVSAPKPVPESQRGTGHLGCETKTRQVFPASREKLPEQWNSEEGADK